MQNLFTKFSRFPMILLNLLGIYIGIQLITEVKWDTLATVLQSVSIALLIGAFLVLTIFYKKNKDAVWMALIFNTFALFLFVLVLGTQ